MMLQPYWCYETNLYVPAEQPIVPSNYPVNGKQKTRISCSESLTDLLNGFRISFDGNHNDMTQSWSQEEYKVRRRVVQFFKNGEKKRIKATFKAIDPVERPKNGIFVSCVYWYDKIAHCDKWYFTSTDYLNLFESLIGIRLTSDEKNRIRRNLEEYKPITVGKNKNNSDEIYKDLMAYSFAKPRNAEKDIKIYEWKYLIHAVEKMVNKYSGRVHAVRIEERAEAGISRLDDNGGIISFTQKRSRRVSLFSWFILTFETFYLCQVIIIGYQPRRIIKRHRDILYLKPYLFLLVNNSNIYIL
jgi:hypothetical protein